MIIEIWAESAQFEPSRYIWILEPSRVKNIEKHEKIDFLVIFGLVRIIDILIKNALKSVFCNPDQKIDLTIGFLVKNWPISFSSDIFFPLEILFLSRLVQTHFGTPSSSKYLVF